MASHLRVLCGRARRGLRDERAAAGDLRSDAPLVRAAFPGDVARILSSRQHNWHGRLLAGRSLGPRRNPLLPDVAAAHLSGDTVKVNVFPASIIGRAGYWLAGLWAPAVTRYYLMSLPLTLAAILLGRTINRRLHGYAFLK